MPISIYTVKIAHSIEFLVQNVRDLTMIHNCITKTVSRYLHVGNCRSFYDVVDEFLVVFR